MQKGTSGLERAVIALSRFAIRLAQETAKYDDVGLRKIVSRLAREEIDTGMTDVDHPIRNDLFELADNLDKWFAEKPAKRIYLKATRLPGVKR